MAAFGRNRIVVVVFEHQRAFAQSRTRGDNRDIALMQLEGAVLEHMDLGIRQMHHAVGCRAEIIDESNAAAIERVAETALAQYPGEVGWSRLATDDRAGHPEACGCDWIFVGADEISANIFEAFETAV